MTYKRLTLGLAVLLGAAAANASVMTSLPDGTIHPMPLRLPPDNVTAGPVTYDGITFTSTFPNSVFGSTQTYFTGNNGNWEGTKDFSPFAGLNAFRGTMTFTLSSPVKGVGGFMNYNVAPFGSANPTIAVFGASGNLIEHTTLHFSTGGGLCDNRELANRCSGAVVSGLVEGLS